MPRECSKARARRLQDPVFAECYFVGEGIDVGGGEDGLGQQEWPRMTSCRTWDVPDGDAQTLDSLADDTLDFLTSSHCLEHMRDPAVALRNWVRVVKPGGHLVITLPNEDLYEQGVFPSTFNTDHKGTFTIRKAGSWSRRSMNVFDLLGRVPGIQVLKVELIHHGYDWEATRRHDQTQGAAECAIEIVLRKERPEDVLHKGRFPAWKHAQPVEAAAQLFTAKARKRLLRKGPAGAMDAALRELWHGDMTRALLMFAAIGEEYPHDSRAYYFAALSVYQAGARFENLDRRTQTVELAISLMRHCIAVNKPNEPNLAFAHYNLGKFLLDLNRPSEAMTECIRAIELRPAFPEALNNLGGIFLHNADYHAADVCYEQALKVQTDNPEAVYNRSFLKLLKGDLAGGFADYEKRWECMGFTTEYKRDFFETQIRWQGEPLRDDAHLLVYAEQGQGDTLQFVRYLPHLRERFNLTVPISVEVQKSLVTLVGTMGNATTTTSGPGGVVLDFTNPKTTTTIANPVTIVTPGEPLPPFTHHVSVMSLPALFGGEIPPTSFPYFRVTPSRTEAFGMARVGLCWAGSRTHRNDHNRSVPFSALAPFSTLPGFSWLSLQVGDREDEAGDAAWLERNNNRWPTFKDTAETMAGLDAVVSADTSVLHLAGALGVPCYAMIPIAPDFRWQLHRTDCPWYPSMTLVRQHKAGDWLNVVERVAALLQERFTRRPDAVLAQAHQ